MHGELPSPLYSALYNAEAEIFCFLVKPVGIQRWKFWVPKIRRKWLGF